MKTLALSAYRATRCRFVKRRFQHYTSLIAASVVLLVATTVYAQNPFGDSGDSSPFDNSGAPNAGAGNSPAGRNLIAEAEEQRRFAEEKDPVVLALRDSKPTTSKEVTRAMQVMMGIRRYDEAKRYLQALEEGNVPEAELAALLQEFGSAFFLEVSRRPEFAPRGRLFVDAVFQASAKVAYDPARVTQQIRNLSNASERVRQAAISDLRVLGAKAINPLLGVLLDESRRDEHLAVQRALVQMGDVVTEPLLSALAAKNEAFRIQLINVLGSAKRQQAVPYLAGRVYASQLSPAERDAARVAVERSIGSMPSQQQVEAYLFRKAKDYLDGGFAGHFGQVLGNARDTLHRHDKNHRSPEAQRRIKP